MSTSNDRDVYIFHKSDALPKDVCESYAPRQSQVSYHEQNVGFPRMLVDPRSDLYIWNLADEYLRRVTQADKFIQGFKSIEEFWVLEHLVENDVQQCACNKNRVYVCLWFLVDAPNGGNLEIYSGNKLETKIRASRGTFVMFPATWTYSYRFDSKGICFLRTYLTHGETDVKLEKPVVRNTLVTTSTSTSTTLIKLFDDNLSPSTCDTLINLIDSGTDSVKPGVTGKGVDLTMKHTFDLLITDAHTIAALKSRLAEGVLQYLRYTGNFVITKLSEYGLKISLFKVQKYKANEGYYHFHVDDKGTRVMVFMWYLNNVDDGGETEFMTDHGRLIVKPKKGSLLLFPSTWTYKHRGNMPTSSDKYICNGWIHSDFLGNNQGMIPFDL